MQTSVILIANCIFLGWEENQDLGPGSSHSFIALPLTAEIKNKFQSFDSSMHF